MRHIVANAAHATPDRARPWRAADARVASVRRERLLIALGLLGKLVGCGPSDRPAPTPAPPPAPSPSATWPPLDEAYLQQASATLSFKLGVPHALAITPDGSVVFRRTPARDRRADLYLLQP